MSKKIEEKPEIRAQEFMTAVRDEFRPFIPRDTIDEVTVSECKEKDGAFALVGSVGTTSPTGKLKTFRYAATVAVDENGNCTLSKLQVSDI